jgi:hypothetical protein
MRVSFPRGQRAQDAGPRSRPQNWLQELSRTQRSGFATFKVRAAPLDRSYVPSPGTQAGQTYDLTLI